MDFTVIASDGGEIRWHGSCSNADDAPLQHGGDPALTVVVGKTPPAGATHYDAASGEFVTVSPENAPPLT
ncbi:MAG: hypothetical protein LBK60_00245 [Verrucomicrobiales bacterium]|jgi:hypothetical protein|nr:hypothetical protein [Verrucomicrobiales bacterium]